MIKKFSFNKSNIKQVDAILAKYPGGREKSAVVPLLELAQRQNNGHLSQEIIEYVAQMLDMPSIRVYEVASFYTMFNLQPVGQYKIQVCSTTPCWLRGSDKIMAKCKKLLGISNKETTGDGKFTLEEVECLGACANAPVVQINDDYYEDLDEDSIQKVITAIQDGNISHLKVGSQKNRKSSKPLGISE